MADSQLAIDYMLKDEGGTFDPTGPSRWGVLLREYQKHFPVATVDAIRNLTRDSAVAYYKAFYWLPNFSLIQNQDVANKIFSTFVNMGTDAIRFVQRSLRIKDDGVLGTITLNLLNSADPAELLQDFRAYQARHYAIWYSEAPTERDYALFGLMRRAVE